MGGRPVAPGATTPRPRAARTRCTPPQGATCCARRRRCCPPRGGCCGARRPSPRAAGSHPGRPRACIQAVAGCCGAAGAGPRDRAAPDRRGTFSWSIPRLAPRPATGSSPGSDLPVHKNSRASPFTKAARPPLGPAAADPLQAPGGRTLPMLGPPKARHVDRPVTASLDGLRPPALLPPPGSDAGPLVRAGPGPRPLRGHRAAEPRSRRLLQAAAHPLLRGAAQRTEAGRDGQPQPGPPLVPGYPLDEPRPTTPP